MDPANATEGAYDHSPARLTRHKPLGHDNGHDQDLCAWPFVEVCVLPHPPSNIKIVMRPIGRSLPASWARVSWTTVSAGCRAPPGLSSRDHPVVGRTVSADSRAADSTPV